MGEFGETLRGRAQAFSRTPSCGCTVPRTRWGGGRTSRPGAGRPDPRGGTKRARVARRGLPPDSPGQCEASTMFRGSTLRSSVCASGARTPLWSTLSTGSCWPGSAGRTRPGRWRGPSRRPAVRSQEVVALIDGYAILGLVDRARLLFREVNARGPMSRPRFVSGLPHSSPPTKSGTSCARWRCRSARGLRALKTPPGYTYFLEGWAEAELGREGMAAAAFQMMNRFWEPPGSSP